MTETELALAPVNSCPILHFSVVTFFLTWWLKFKCDLTFEWPWESRSHKKFKFYFLQEHYFFLGESWLLHSPYVFDSSMAPDRWCFLSYIVVKVLLRDHPFSRFLLNRTMVMNSYLTKQNLKAIQFFWLNLLHCINWLIHHW
jgi:hypothetical protein